MYTNELSCNITYDLSLTMPDIDSKNHCSVLFLILYVYYMGHAKENCWASLAKKIVKYFILTLYFIIEECLKT